MRDTALRQEQRRADRLTDAQIRREDAAAAAQVRIAAGAAAAKERRADEQARADRAAAERHQRREHRDARVAALRGWAAGRAVDLLIYPAVGIAFVLAGPSMALYGEQVYASRLGWLLPGISELLMLAFALAVLVSRRRQPERPVVMLQAGVWVFAALSAGLNFLHGLDRGWSAGVVMALVAISGIVAHQLTLATPPRSVAERAESRITRMAARKIARVRRAAVRQAAAELYPDGGARLVHTPGHYTLTWDGRRLTPAAAPPGHPARASASGRTPIPAAPQQTTPPVPESAESPADPGPGPAPAPTGAATELRAVPALRPDPGPRIHAEVTPATPPADRPTGQTADRPTDRTGERSADRPVTQPVGGRARPARKRAGRRRTDAQIAEAVRELAGQNGGTPPSQYQLKQRFGIGSGRAARLLAGLDTPDTTPGPAGDGREQAATREDGEQ